MIRHEVVVIGGSLAGAAALIALRRHGVEAVAFDRDCFPRRKVCGSFLSPGSVDGLGKLGVLDGVLAAGAVTIRRVRLRLGPESIELPLARPGLGLSRERLDTLMVRRAGVREGHAVRGVTMGRAGFAVTVVRPDGRTETCAAGVVIDAAGRFSRFTRRRTTAAYGVRFLEDGSGGDGLDFRFFPGGYGGSVAVEDGRTNSCFMVEKSAVAGLLARHDCVVTGPIAYDAEPGSYLAVGDAAGMIDPFSGEGMRQAIESGLLAADLVAEGIREGASYEVLRRRYREAWRRAWARKRRTARLLRHVLDRPSTFRALFSVGHRFPFLAARYVGELWK